jgi:hypothetical protein
MNRRPLTLLFGVFLAFGLNTQIGWAQTGPGVLQPPRKKLVSKTHHIVGQIEKGSWSEGCPRSLTGAKLQVIESWYKLTANGLVPQPGGRVLGAVTLTADKNFDVQWLEPSWPSRVPWKKVQSGGTGRITVYRLVSLRVGMGPNAGSITLDPVPTVTFSGEETVKNVGTIRVDCFFAY